MRNFLLLFVVGLHLVDFVLTLGLDERRVVTGIIDELNELQISPRFIPASLMTHLLLGREFDDISTNGVHKVLRMRCDNENVIIG